MADQITTKKIYYKYQHMNSPVIIILTKSSYVMSYVPFFFFINSNVPIITL